MIRGHRAGLVSADLLDSALALGVYVGLMSVLALTFYYLWHWGD